MKLIKAFIRPELLEEVYIALRREGYPSMTVFEGEGTGRFSDPESSHGSLDFPAMHNRIVKIEIAAQDANCDSIIHVIKEQGCTGGKGDGVIFVSPIDQALRIRDGKKGPEVLN
ncbi:P-II family nitrogen regulator [Balneolaceae bacterium YR4-1]|uniref:P-II family nitrogen regulator n=1 Tax=Halalkalibaculum roseum TaxID=2709311 RepID=A0A6M1STP6_9BACT|nr:P-II family nitrogen regulator [Halalkalibaculum roseum]NGP75516.1 P-II family nitrogen regulator [Halalkalibaculum roseum]